MLVDNIAWYFVGKRLPSWGMSPYPLSVGTNLSRWFSFSPGGIWTRPPKTHRSLKRDHFKRKGSSSSPITFEGKTRCWFSRGVNIQPTPEHFGWPFPINYNPWNTHFYWKTWRVESPEKLPCPLNYGTIYFNRKYILQPLIFKCENVSEWWQLKYFLCSPRTLGFHDPIWRAYFSDGWGKTTN